MPYWKGAIAIMQHMVIAFQLSKRDVLLMSFCSMMRDCQVLGRGRKRKAMMSYLLKGTDSRLFNCR